MSDAPVLYTVADGVATLALNQPDTRNALSDELLDALLAAFERARATTTPCARSCSRAPTRRSSAPAATSPASPPTSRSSTSTPAIERFPRLFELIGTLGKPTICAAGGHVLAGALGLALACDLVVARRRRRSARPRSTSASSRS